MASSKSTKDPTVASGTTAPDYPEGTHPARPPSETSYAPMRNDYKDNPDKPDQTSIAQVEVLTSDVDKDRA